MRLCVLISAFCLATASGIGSVQAAGCDAQNLTGTWNQISAKRSDEPDPPPEGTRLMFITPGHFATIGYDPTGKVTYVSGGSAQLSGDSVGYTAEFTLKGEPSHQDVRFSCDMQGNRVTFKASRPNGPSVESVYEKVAPSGPSERK